MTDRQQSAFFFAIVFLFTSGIGLVIYRQYDQYYQQKAAIDLEAASTAIPAKKVAVTTTPEQVSAWKIYKNDQYGFEFEYPSVWGDLAINSASDQGQNEIELGCNQMVISGGAYVCPISMAVFPAQLFSNSKESFIKTQAVDLYTGKPEAVQTLDFGNNKIFKFNNSEANYLILGKSYYIELYDIKNLFENSQELSKLFSTFKFTK